VRNGVTLEESRHLSMFVSFVLLANLAYFTTGNVQAPATVRAVRLG
jgi:hypothetical protein